MHLAITRCSNESRETLPASSLITMQLMSYFLPVWGLLSSPPLGCTFCLDTQITKPILNLTVQKALIGAPIAALPDFDLICASINIYETSDCRPGHIDGIVSPLLHIMFPSGNEEMLQRIRPRSWLSGTGTAVRNSLP